MTMNQNSRLDTRKIEARRPAVTSRNETATRRGGWPVERATRDARQASVTDEDGEVVGDFLELAGHELRAPLAALKGHAQMLQRRLAHPPERADGLPDRHKVL